MKVKTLDFSDQKTKGRQSTHKTIRSSILVSGSIIGLIAGPAYADSVADAFTQGHASIELRPRYEIVVQKGKADAYVFTNRTLLGYSTKPIEDFSATLQVINVADLTGSYNSLVNGKTKYASVPDPSATNINQASFSYTGLSGTTIVGGRQIVNLDDVRFVGNADFRQNMQTLDALTVVNKPLPDVKISAGYSWGIKDILNRHVPARIFLGEIYWTPMKEIQGEAFSYWYGNQSNSVVLGAAACALVGSKACNSVTYGLRAHGTLTLPSDFSLDYKGTFAKQSSYDAGSALIDAEYYQASGKLQWTKYFIGAEYMLMGSNGNGTYGFQTPLATKHAFNGWAEMFLTTPSKGLESLQANAGMNIFGANFIAKYYYFKSDYKSMSYGNEVDLSLTYPLSVHWQGGVEYANYKARGFGADTEAGWAYVTMRY